MRTMLAQFASHELAGLPVTLTIRGAGTTLLEHETLTNAEGYAHFDLPLEPFWDLPLHPEWEIAHLAWSNGHSAQSIAANVLAPGRDSDLAVISDIDDTIIETGITGGMLNVARNWRRIFAQLPHERIAVAGADQFYGDLGGGTQRRVEDIQRESIRDDETPDNEISGDAILGDERPDDAIRPGESLSATRRPFFYVSSSPWNLFSYLVAFQRTKGLPVGPLLLRDWGFNRATLGSTSHGAHKRVAIDSIMAMYPGLRFALIGDDTQGDLPAFADIVRDYPGRVAAVFLRTVSRQPLSVEELACKTLIEQSGVPLWLGESFSVGLDFLSTLGFTPGGETEQIVRAIEKDTPSDPAPHRSG